MKRKRDALDPEDMTSVQSDWTNVNPYGEPFEPQPTDAIVSGRSIVKGALYSSDPSYYIDAGDGWSASQPTSYQTFTTTQPTQAVPVPPSSVIAPHQSYFHESLAYDNMTSLPPMSSFRPTNQTAVGVTPSGYPQPTVTGVGPTPISDVGKGLVPLYSGSQTVAGDHQASSSYGSGSASSTPVSSPTTNWSRITSSTSTASFGNSTDPTASHLHTLVCHLLFVILICLLNIYTYILCS